MSRFILSGGRAALFAAALSLGCSSGSETDAVAGGGQGGEAGSPGGGGAGGAPLPAPDPAAFREVASMGEARLAHTMTTLPDGRVLVVGGEPAMDDPMTRTVEIFDPVSEAWSAAGDLPEPRANHTATLLPDGRVLIAGGGKSSIIGNPSGEEVTASALLFDPVTGVFTPTGSMTEPRAAHRAHLLPGGRVLVAGGGTDEVFDICAPQYPDCTISATLASAEVFDPAAGTWTSVAPMMDSRMSFTLTALPDGGALAVAGFSSVAGDSLATAEAFDPAAMAWTPAGTLLGVDRMHHFAARLGSGRVLVAGGKRANVGPTAGAEIFDPQTGAWAATAPLDQPLTGAILVELESGRVLRAGGFNQFDGATVDVAAVFDEAVGTWTAIGAMNRRRSLHAAARLSSGKVLVCGGVVGSGSATNRCEIAE